jgi:hypothetical protein
VGGVIGEGRDIRGFVVGSWCRLCVRADAKLLTECVLAQAVQ